MAPVTEQVSGNTAEFEVNNLEPATQYTVSVHAVKDDQKSAPATVSFTTGKTSAVPLLTPMGCHFL